MLTDNFLLIFAYLCLLDKYQATKNIVYKYCIVIILYFENYYILEVKKFSFVILAKDYYNIVYKIVPNKNKLKIINSLLIVL